MMMVVLWLIAYAALVWLVYVKLLNAPPLAALNDPVWVAWLLVPPVYFIPWFLAKLRRHPQSLAIFIANVAFGFTLIGWVIVLIWAALEGGRESEA
jgi:hypothetical protein